MRISKPNPSAQLLWQTAPRLAAVAELIHGFTCRSAGDLSTPHGRASLEAATGGTTLRLLRQVHGLCVVRADDPREIPEGDAWAGIPPPGTLLGILTADCLPVLLCHPPTRTLGLAHAGWRGAVRGIAPLTLERMGVPPTEVRAALGPSIGPCCYQVGSDVAEAVGPGSPHLSPWEGTPNKYRLDLAGLTMQQLRSSGLSADAVERVGGCTRCRTDLFFSYRAEGRTGRLCAFMGWRAP